MFVIKRNGEKESVKFDKITRRIEKLLFDIDNIDATLITQKICNRIFSGITTTELDNLASQVCMSMVTENINYGTIGSRLVISNHQKNTKENFLEVVIDLRNNKDILGNLAPLVSEEVLDIAEKYQNEINEIIDNERDYLLDYFAFKTLEKAYLLKLDKKVVERPQHLFMRVAIGIHGDDLENVKKTYDNISLKNYTHATPTLFNAGTPYPQLSSCYLTATEDSVEGIYETITDCAKISKWAGGIGIHISNIRANGSYIRKTGGTTNGIMPMLKVYNDTARYINQCILPDVKVYSKLGIKRMDEVTLDDNLLTKDGSYKKINQIFINRKNEKILEIHTTTSLQPLKCTNNHEIYRIQPTCKKTGFERIKKQIELGSIKREFVLAENIKKDDYLGYPIPTFESDNKWNVDTCRLYGLLLGDGNITITKDSSRYQITLNNNKKIICKDYVINLLKNLDIHYWISNECEICWTYNNENIEKIRIKYEDLYDFNHEKKCLPEILHLPKHKISMVIKGLLDSDGCVTNTGIYFVNTSLNLIESLTYMLLRLGILTSVQIINKIGKIMSKNSKGKDIIARKICYNLRIPKVNTLKENNIFHNFKSTNQRNYFEHDGILYSRVKKIEYKNYEGNVYDFNMEDNHNYLTTSGLVHNSGKRNGSFAMYIEPWHADIFTFLDAKKNHGAEEERARDLFYALWIPDLFMKSVENNEDWYLMCPDKCPGLSDVYGEEFDNLYKKYIEENRYNKKIKARDLWEAIISSQVETGTPYMLYKDAANKKSNQKNIGTIKSSNLCVSGDTEIQIRENLIAKSIKIKDLVEQKVEVWNGKQWSKTIVKKTGENQKLLNIIFSNSSEIKCTEYHKFYILEDGKEIIYEAQNLEIGMKIIPYTKWINESTLCRVDDIYILDIKECLEKEDTFCFNEPLEHKGIFNGIITGQCAEIIEYSGNDETAVCLTSDTIIFTDKGLRKITECDNENILSFYNNDNDLVKNQQYIKAKLIDNGIKEVFEIDLVGGFPIKATKNHKFLVVKNRNYNKKYNTYEWKTVEELTLKDRINRPKIDPLPNFENINIIEDLDTESLVVGWMIGDGWQRNYDNGHKYTYGVCFGSHEVYAQKTVLEQLNKIQINLEALTGGHNKKVNTYISKNGVVQWACSKQSFAKYFIDNYGLEPKLGKNKIISEKINKLEPFKIASILSGLFSADGTVYRKTGKKNSFYVGLSSASKQLLIDVQLLLKCFGITSCLVFGEVKSRKRFQGKLTIENKDSIKLFSKYINFLLCPEKKQKLEYGILNHVYSCEIDEREWMSIRSIKNVGFENVYDLNIPNSHNFVANMVTVHNCNLASICLQNILESPNIKEFSPSHIKWTNLLTKEERELFDLLNDNEIKIFTNSDCTYCKLLKSLLNKVGFTYNEIDAKEAEMLRIKSEPTLATVKPFETVPQLFVTKGCDYVRHIGGYDDCWKFLKPKINYKKLKNLAYDLTINLNKIIDKNYYPIEKTRVSNMRNRPIGIGVQGLADLFINLRLPFESDESMDINKKLFETIYYGAMESSINLSEKDGFYQTYLESPLSEGLFQYQLWGMKDEDLSVLWDWKELREKLLKYGARNSLLIALMPTASTSQIMGSNECLVGDTKVSTTNGLSYNIEDLVENVNVYGWNKLDNCINVSDKINHLNQGIKDTIKLTLQDGRIIECTKNHKILTDNGWKNAENLNLEDNIICSLENTFDKNYGDEENYVLKTDTINFSMENKEERYKLLAYSRILGFLLSDGSISKNSKTGQYTIELYPSNQIDANSLINDISLFEEKPKIEKNTKGLKLRLKNNLIKSIVSLDNICVGRRSDNGLIIPSFLLENSCPKSVIREFLAAHFGGDGCIPSFQYNKNNNASLSGCYIGHTIIKNKINILTDTMNKFIFLFKRFDIECKLSKPITTPLGKYELRLKISPGSSLLENIGVRYDIEKQLKLSAATSYWRFREKIIKQREDILKLSFNNYFDKKLTYKNALEKSIEEYKNNNVIIHPASIPKYDNVRKWICKDLSNFSLSHRGFILNASDIFEKMKCRKWFDNNEYLINEKNINNIPYFILKVIKIEENCKKQVWDISVNKTHSFIANGIMVHNCFEPYTSNIYTRRTLAGEFTVVNKYLMEDLVTLDLWNDDVKDRMIYDKGSVKNIKSLPKFLKDVYKTVWEVSQKNLILMSAQRGPFICQSQSLNLFFEQPNFKTLSSAHFIGWKNGLKTGSYYIRSKPALASQRFGFDAKKEKEFKKDEEEEGCVACSA
jgi:ribonucleotide reductase alpha subunit